VGATRAVSELLLTACVELDDKHDTPRESSRHSLLSPIWQEFREHMTLHRSTAGREQGVEQFVRTAPTRQLSRLRRTAAHSVAVVDVTELPQKSKARIARQDNFVERSIGIVLHQALEQLSMHPILPASCCAGDLRRWRMALQQQGLWGDVVESALQEIHIAISLSLSANHVGRWILSSAHVGARSEWALTTATAQGQIRDIVIDRSFIDQDTGLRWVIDYKSSRPAPAESLEDFVVRESAAHMEQLRCYRDAVRMLGAEPVRCALYFTALGHLHTVTELDLPAAESRIKTCDL
jgi:ATP-dependent exoDNAse (exonuclease V) beta subunit